MQLISFTPMALYKKLKHLVMKPHSMFTYLYLQVLIGLVATVMLFFYFGEDSMRRTEVDIFLNDGSYFVDLYAKSRNSPHSLFKELSQNHFQTFYIFDLKLLNNWDESAPCSGCSLLYTLQSIPVYLTSDDTYLAVFPLPNSSHSLVFSETTTFFRPDIAWHDDAEVRFAGALSVTLCLALAFLVYVPIHIFRKKMENLTTLQSQFGQGSMSVRSQVYTTSPLRELSESFNSMAEDIESRVKQSDIFSGAIPHEIRTPLSRIQMASDIVRRKLPKEDHALFNDIDDYIQDISNLTSDILQLSRLSNIDNKRFEKNKRTLLLSDFCRDRVSAVSSGIGRFIEVDTEAQHWVTIEQTLARLVLDNLIKNAHRYGNGEVVVTLRYFECCWSIDVEDNGFGIPADKREEIFVAFSRLDLSRNANNGGFGLGLAIATSAAKQLGWRLSVDDSHLGGARFTILMPYSTMGVAPQITQ